MRPTFIEFRDAARDNRRVLVNCGDIVQVVEVRDLPNISAIVHLQNGDRIEVLTFDCAYNAVIETMQQAGCTLFYALDDEETT